MFGRIGYTWEVMQASWHVLKQEKMLLIFPVLSGLACLLVSASFAVPIFLTDAFRPPDPEDASVAEQVAYYGVAFLFYFCNYFVITFFNSATVGAAVMRLSGHDPDFNDALQSATKRLPQILAWSVVAATVGMILRMIEDRSEKIGQIVVAVLGTAWNVTTFLVVPVLVVEGKNPIEAFQRSAGLLRKTWGQQLAGNFGFGIIFFLLALPAILAIVAAFALGPPEIGIAVLVLAILYLIVLGVVQAALQSIFQAAVYVYAAHGQEPEAFGHGTLAHAMSSR
jgi:hypothetical protein